MPQIMLLKRRLRGGSYKEISSALCDSDKTRGNGMELCQGRGGRGLGTGTLPTRDILWFYNSTEKLGICWIRFIKFKAGGCSGVCSASHPRWRTLDIHMAMDMWFSEGNSSIWKNIKEIHDCSFLPCICFSSSGQQRAAESPIPHVQSAPCAGNIHIIGTHETAWKIPRQLILLLKFPDDAKLEQHSRAMPSPSFLPVPSISHLKIHTSLPSKCCLHPCYQQYDSVCLQPPAIKTLRGLWYRRQVPKSNRNVLHLLQTPQ